MKRFFYRKQWRAVGASEHDIFHRDTKAQAERDSVGQPTEVYAVIQRAMYGKLGDEVVADCYSPDSARRVRDALNQVEAK